MYYSDEWIVPYTFGRNDDAKMVRGLIIIDSITLAMLLLNLFAVFRGTTWKKLKSRKGYQNIGFCYTTGLVLYTLQVIIIIVFLDKFGGEYYSGNRYYLLPLSLRSISMFLFIASLYGISGKIANPDKKRFAGDFWSWFFCLLVVTIIRIAVNVRKEIRDLRGERTDILEAVYALTYTICVALGYLACIWAFKEMLSERANITSLRFMLFLTFIVTISYSITHVVYASYHEIGERATSLGTALGLGVVRMLFPAIAFGCMLGVRTCRAIEDDQPITDSSQSMSGVSGFGGSVFRRRVRTPPPSYQEPPSYAEAV